MWPAMAFADPVNETLFRYLHILSGITWIGLLYFFNLVNLPLLKFPLKKPFDVDMGEKAPANIALKTLFWFRWGAMFTFLFGLLLVYIKAQQGIDAGEWAGHAGYFLENGVAGHLILLGVILGTVMWFNVWFIIWPNQQVIMTNNKKTAAGVSDDEKSAMAAENGPRMKNAVLASRFNTWASIPMLFGMVFGAHGGFARTDGWDALRMPLLALAVILLLMVYLSNKKD